MGRAPVTPPHLRELYAAAHRVILRHQPVMADRLRCSFCREAWQCDALLLARQAQRVALYLVLISRPLSRRLLGGADG